MLCWWRPRHTAQAAGPRELVPLEKKGFEPVGERCRLGDLCRWG